MELRIKFKDYECFLNIGKYSNGRLALELIDTEDCCPVATASVNIPDASLADDEILIKSWSENEGMADLLMNLKVIGPELEKVPTGFVYATKHKVLNL